jgi:phosphoserine aminotransferase
MARVMNFSAGPAALPEEALLRAKEELLDWDGTGMSVMEQSHRGKAYERVHLEALSLVKKLLGIRPEHKKRVLFVQGGATQVFATLPMNFLGAGATADYVVAGAWGEKAVAEAKPYVKAIGATLREVPWEGAGKGTRMPHPSELSFTEGAAYVHTTSNETIHGTEVGLDSTMPFPVPKAPHVCDMSSDFLGRVIDPSKFSMIYAGAQKNIGASGVVVLVIDDTLLEGSQTDIPGIFRYATHAKNDSLYNTPPTFAIYLVRNVLAWLDAQGGVAEIEKRNREKARLVYEAIDQSSGFYSSPVEVRSRSIMNVVFRLPSQELEAKFLSEAEKHGMVGLKGHRVVGGMRASLYNAVSVESARALAELMREVARVSG